MKIIELTKLKKLNCFRKKASVATSACQTDPVNITSIESQELPKIHKYKHFHDTPAYIDMCVAEYKAKQGRMEAKPFPSFGWRKSQSEACERTRCDLVKKNGKLQYIQKFGSGSENCTIKRAQRASRKGNLEKSIFWPKISLENLKNDQIEVVERNF